MKCLGASSRDPALLRTPLLAVGAVTQRRVNIGSSLSSQQFAEAQFYLSHYGNAEMHVAFLIRHGFFERAYAVVAERKMPAQAFVDTVFVPLLRHELADDFRAFIKRTDPHGCHISLLHATFFHPSTIIGCCLTSSF